MSFELIGKVKYARHMQGTAKTSGNAYSFFSLVVLDTDEGIRVPLQLSSDHPQFADMCAREKTMIDQPVKVLIRSFSPGMKKEKDSEKEVPTVRFFAGSVVFASDLAQSAQPAASPQRTQR